MANTPTPPIFDCLQQETQMQMLKWTSLINQLCKLYFHVTKIKFTFISKRVTANYDINALLRASRSGSWFQKHSLILGKLLGEGVVGKVFLMKTNFGKRYALKVTRTTFDFSEMRSIQIEKNSMILCRGHRNILQLKASTMVHVKDEEFLFLSVLEYADFGTLIGYFKKLWPDFSTLYVKYFMKKPNLDPPNEMVRDFLDFNANFREHKDSNEVINKGYRHVMIRFSYEILNAVGHIHRRGLIHSDLHYENVMIGKGFHVKIGDFGLSNIGHPLYDPVRYEFGYEFEKIDDSDEEFGLGVLKCPDVERDLNFCEALLCQLATGLPPGPIFLEREQMNTIKRYVVPIFNETLFYDKFLFDYRGMLGRFISLKPEKGRGSKTLKRDPFFVNIKKQKYDEYNKYDISDYIRLLYQERQIGPNLETVSPFVEVSAGEDSIRRMLDNTLGEYPLPGFLDESLLRQH